VHRGHRPFAGERAGQARGLEAGAAGGRAKAPWAVGRKVSTAERSWSCDTWPNPPGWRWWRGYGPGTGWRANPSRPWREATVHLQRQYPVQVGLTFQAMKVASPAVSVGPGRGGSKELAQTLVTAAHVRPLTWRRRTAEILERFAPWMGRVA
jgi:hypothetical protein